MDKKINKYLLIGMIINPSVIFIDRFIYGLEDYIVMPVLLISIIFMIIGMKKQKELRK